MLPPATNRTISPIVIASQCAHRCGNPFPCVPVAQNLRTLINPHRSCLPLRRGRRPRRPAQNRLKNRQSPANPQFSTLSTTPCRFLSGCEDGCVFAFEGVSESGSGFGMGWFGLCLCLGLWLCLYLVYVRMHLHQILRRSIMFQLKLYFRIEML